MTWLLELLRRLLRFFRRLVDPEEFQDAICEPDHLREIIRDEWAVWLVLFAEAIPRGPAAIEARRLEWVAIFGDPRDRDQGKQSV